MVEVLILQVHKLLVELLNGLQRIYKRNQGKGHQWWCCTGCTIFRQGGCHTFFWVAIYNVKQNVRNGDPLDAMYKMLVEAISLLGGPSVDIVTRESGCDHMWPSDPGINFTKKWITGGFSMTIFPALVKTYEQCSKPPVGLLDGVINCPVYIGDSHNPWKIIQKPMVSPPFW